jgi:hypothetical protein
VIGGIEPMMKRPIRSSRGVALALAACLSLAGCASSAPTPVDVVFMPTATPVSTAAATAAATPTVVATATLPSAPTAAPTPGPTSRAEFCTGNATDRDFFAAAAADLPFDVYCAILPSSWWVVNHQYTTLNGGLLQIEYRGSAGQQISIYEGNVCPAACAPEGNGLGPGSFDGLTGNLYYLAPTYKLVVGPAGHPLYYTRGNVSGTDFRAWTAAVRRVPKSLAGVFAG